MKILTQVIDVETDNPVLGMSVEVLNPDGSTTGKGGVTDNNGKIGIDSPLLDIPGAKLRFTHVSYNPTTIKPVDVDDKLYVARSTANTLQTVVVVAKNNKSLILNIIIIIIMIFIFKKLIKL